MLDPRSGQEVQRQPDQSLAADRRRASADGRRAEARAGIGDRRARCDAPVPRAPPPRMMLSGGRSPTPSPWSREGFRRPSTPQSSRPAQDDDVPSSLPRPNSKGTAKRRVPALGAVRWCDARPVPAGRVAHRPARWEPFLLAKKDAIRGRMCYATPKSDNCPQRVLWASGASAGGGPRFFWGAVIKGRCLVAPFACGR